VLPAIILNCPFYVYVQEDGAFDVNRQCQQHNFTSFSCVPEINLTQKVQISKLELVTHELISCGEIKNSAAPALIFYREIN
jgi:hypothetical protein